MADRCILALARTTVYHVCINKGRAISVVHMRTKYHFGALSKNGGKMETELETDREAGVVREEEGTAEGEREPGTISSAGNEDKEAKKEPEKVSSTLSVVSQISYEVE